MLATVVCKDSHNGIKGFLKDFFSQPQISLDKKSVPDGDYFYIVTVNEHHGQIPVKQAVEKLKRIKGSVIFDINFPCDENTHCLEFHPQILPSMLLFNSFIAYIKELSLSPLGSSLTVYDNNGIYADLIEKAVPLFSRIEVFTQNEAAYGKVSRFLLDEYGISLSVSSVFSGKAPKTTAVLCPENVPFSDFYNGMLFTLSSTAPPCSFKATGYGINLAPEYDLLRPAGIDKMLFACALYEKCGVKKLGRLCFNKLKII